MLFSLRLMKNMLTMMKEDDISIFDGIRMDLLSIDMSGIHSDLLRRYLVSCLNLLEE